MCNHVKFKTSEKDRIFLRTQRIAPFECCKCEGRVREQKALPAPKLRVEEASQDEGGD